ncbi:MAG TPA: hypothetical protein VN809_02155 [Telmatospirillum sp.]|nr:hypothetical protein [Telmatospirillum sp.]
MSFHLRELRQACRDRQREIAARVALIDKLGPLPREDPSEPCGEDVASQLSPWEAIFARPEWRRAPESHDGRCSCCGAAVSLDKATCDICGAVWGVPANNKARLCVFCILSVVLSIVGGYFIGKSFPYIIHHYYNFIFNGRLINYGFVNFMESYIWVSGTFLILLLATYLFEKLNIGSKGMWAQGRASKEDWASS